MATVLRKFRESWADLDRLRWAAWPALLHWAALGCFGLHLAAFGSIGPGCHGLHPASDPGYPKSGIRSIAVKSDGRDRAPMGPDIYIRDPIRIPIREPIRGPIEGSEIRHSRHPIRHPIWVSRPGGIGIGLHWAALGRIGLVVAAFRLLTAASGSSGLLWAAFDGTAITSP